jgi:hypothetical protein
VDGIRFVADARWRFALAGVVVDVQDYYGREALVAYDALGGGC